MTLCYWKRSRACVNPVGLVVLVALALAAILFASFRPKSLEVDETPSLPAFTRTLYSGEPSPVTRGSPVPTAAPSPSPMARVGVSPVPTVAPTPSPTARVGVSPVPTQSHDATLAQDGLTIGAIAPDAEVVSLYEKFEATFSIDGTAAGHPDFPYDSDSPPGLPGRIGITVDGLFLPPGQSDWSQALVQPAFRYQAFERVIAGEGEGLYPVGEPVWQLRFAPTSVGTWQYKVRAQDSSICPADADPCPYWAETPSQTFQATPAKPGQHGFVRVSRADPRYFEFSDGTAFLGLGHQTDFGSDTQVEGLFDTYQANGVNLLRAWMSATGVYGLGFWFWDTWANSTLVFTPTYPGSDVAARIVGSGDSPCIFHGFGEGALAALKGNRTYQLQIRAKLEGVDGPRVAGNPFGLVAKFGDWPKGICGEPDNELTTLSPYWNGTADWTVYSATFSLPQDVIVGWDGYFTIALENTNGGSAYIDEVRISEGAGGPNILPRGNMNYDMYYDQASSWRWDTILDQAAERNVFLKLVILEKQDGIFDYIRPDGTIAPEPSDDNFYGVNPDDWGQATKVRRLHEYFWRYLSARWGYSTAVHSWELLNEGDPYSGFHYDQANALGRVIRETDPNHHLVTTSFWHSFPVEEFWANSSYPYVDYADFHAYIDSTWLNAPDDIIDNSVKQQCGSDQTCYQNAMKNDSALYHSEHSLNAWRRAAGKPVVRGEAGLTLPGTIQEPDPNLMADKDGVWLHQFLFSQVGPGGLTDLYWFTDEILANDLYPVFKRFRDFMQDIPFTNGYYTDIDASVSNPNLRVSGQKDSRGTSAHFWAQNREYTWWNVVQGQPATPQSGIITIEGLKPGSFTVEQWDTYQGKVSGQWQAVVNDAGQLSIAIDDVSTDAAYKLYQEPSPSGDTYLLYMPLHVLRYSERRGQYTAH